MREERLERNVMQMQCAAVVQGTAVRRRDRGIPELWDSGARDTRHGARSTGHWSTGRARRGSEGLRLQLRTASTSVRCAFCLYLCVWLPYEECEAAGRARGCTHGCREGRLPPRCSARDCMSAAEALESNHRFNHCSARCTVCEVSLSAQTRGPRPATGGFLR